MGISHTTDLSQRALAVTGWLNPTSEQRWSKLTGKWAKPRSRSPWGKAARHRSSSPHGAQARTRSPTKARLLCRARGALALFALGGFRHGGSGFSGCKEWGFRVQDGSGSPGLAGGPMTSPPDGAEGTLSLGRSVEDCKEMPESQKAL